MNDADWAVEVDRLLSEGDPRGTLALRTPEVVEHRDLDAVSLALAEPLIGPIWAPVRHGLTWHHGYWEHFGNWTAFQEDSFWHALFAHPSARHLRRLSLRWIRESLFLELLEAHRPPLETLHWNDRDDAIGLDPYLQALPELRHLHLWRKARIEHGTVQPLETLSVNAGDLPELSDDLVRLARRGALEHLQVLEIWSTSDLTWTKAMLEHSRPRHLAFKGSIGASAIAPLVTSPAFGEVKQLTLEGFWPGDDLIHLVRALENRAPLEAYHSTGQVPAPALVTRLQACARTCSIRP